MAVKEYSKLQPQAVELEEAVLGALMLEKDAYEKIRDVLSDNSFYKDTNRTIFLAIKALILNNEPVDILTVTNLLTKKGQIDNVGGAFYITQLTDKVANAGHIEYHARIIAQKYIQRQLIAVTSEIQNKAYSDIDPKESFDLWDEAAKKIDAITGNDSNGRIVGDIVGDSIKAYERREELDKMGMISGIPSFSKAIVEHTNGWQPDNLIIVAGRPGSGKTAYVLAEAKAASKNGDIPCFFSLEMSDISLVDRLVIAEAEGLDSDDISGYSQRFRKGRLTKDEKERMYLAESELRKLNMFVDDKAGCTIDYISKVCKQRVKKGLCDMVIIDYLQLITADSKKGRNREQEVAEMSRKLKCLAKELNVPVFLLAQLNRAVENRPNKQPIMADLRESGGIEQDADIIIFPFRPRYYILQDSSFERLISEGYSDKYPDTDWNKTAMMIFAKDRANGPTKILVEVNDSCTTWRDVQEENEEIDHGGYQDYSEGMQNTDFEDKEIPF